MTSARSRMLLISTSAVSLSLLGVVVAPQLHGLWLRLFVVLYALIMTALFAYVAAKMMEAKRRQR